MERWLGFWDGLQLDELHGHPVWEEELHAVLRPSFNELCRLFVYYCNTPPQGETDLSPPSPEVQAQRSRMPSPHWLTLAHDLKLGDALKLGSIVHHTNELSDERLQWLFLSRTPGGHPASSWAEFIDMVPEVPEDEAAVAPPPASGPPEDNQVQPAGCSPISTRLQPCDRHQP